MSKRPETGPMVFDGDWPGVFIRGDSAWSYANLLKDALEDKPLNKSAIEDLNGLVALLCSCNIYAANTPMKYQRVGIYPLKENERIHLVNWGTDSLDFQKEFCPIKDPPESK